MMDSVLEKLPAEGLREVFRARVYAFLSGVFSRPNEQRIAQLRSEIPNVIEAVNALGALPEARHACGVLTTELRKVESDCIDRKWYACFDPSGGLLVPPTETHYTADSPAHGMTRGYEMADVAAFYKALGVNVRAESERPDHIIAELDFLHLLAVKLAVAIAEGNDEGAEVCRKARESFLVDHVVRWVGMFCQLLNETEQVGPFYSAAGRFLLTFLQGELLTTKESSS
jgi:TorA maturation chaperone TorD